MPEEKKRSRASALFFEWLPMIYIVSGLIIVIGFRNLIALAAGTALIGAGGIEHLRQKTARQQREAGNSRMTSRMSENAEGPATQMLMQMTWRKSFEVGHPVIDQQHRRLFAIGDKLINAVLKNKPRETVEDLLDELNEQIEAHFKTEEAVMARTRFPLSKEHRVQHESLLEKARALREQYRTEQIDAGAMVGFIAYELVTEHIINEDSKFALGRQPTAA